MYSRKEVAPYLRDGLGGKIFNACNYVFMLLLAFTMIYPFWNQLILSLNEGTDSVRGGLYFLPRKFTLENYEYMFSRRYLFDGAVMSVMRVVIGTSTHVFFSGLLAYVTTVRGFSGRRVMRVIFIATMYFSGGMIPFFLLIANLGLMNTFTVYWLPGMFSAYSMLLIASYIYGLPDSLAESARIDGAGDFRIYFSIILPLCVPVIAAVSIMTAVAHWNSWFDVMIYNPSGQYDTLSMYLRRILLNAEEANRLAREGWGGREVMQNVTIQSMRAATTMIVTLPIIAVYPFFQRFFVSGITIGSVKG
ncbi:MAG: carbohydrate ABC transporter permease [Oscillospiraceae bacterium]|jgi:putative aldouronate transport system permease protein|nr:carbohydrate ABC transporter permease [Oscillospiraceae bacterium]